MKSLSFAILTHNETTEIRRLLSILTGRLRENREIVIVDDFSFLETRRVLEQFSDGDRVQVFQRRLHKHFGNQRNYLGSKCSGRYLFVLDPDEAPPPAVMDNLDDILHMMEARNIDVCSLPMLNTVEGLTASYIRKYRVKMDELERLDWPGRSPRIIRKRPGMKCVNSVHEQLVGYQRLYNFPADPKFAIRHHKSIERFRASKDFYRTFPRRRREKLQKSIRKRANFLRRLARVERAQPLVLQQTDFEGEWD
ncbi:MAG: glycosyltransferase family 2 protein [Kiloniellaceae bacterium]